MPRKLFASLTGLLALTIAFGVWWSVVAHASASAQAAEPPGPTPVGDRREAPDAPAISFIDNPEPSCIQENKIGDVCYIQWRYLSVTAGSSSYIISMTVSIDNRMRAYYGGFFQTSMYAPAEMHTPGFKVSCGSPGAAGKPLFGRAYSYTVRARETSGLKSANYGSVTCPAGPYKIFLPTLKR